MDNFERDFLSELGFDPDDPSVRAAADDAQTHARIIETLVHIRTDRTMTQTAVAKRMGTTQSRVSNFERIGGDPRLSTLDDFPCAAQPCFIRVNKCCRASS